MVPHQSIDESLETEGNLDGKVEVKLVLPTDGKVREREPCLVFLSANWRSVLEDMGATSEACYFQVDVSGLQRFRDLILFVFM